MNATPAFSRRGALALIAGGAALFVALLWLVGAGLAHGPLNDGGAHGAGKGLTGYAAIAALLERQGWEVHQARNQGELRGPGLVVLTPPAGASGKDLERVVSARRSIGPTLVVTPKPHRAPLPRWPRPTGTVWSARTVAGTPERLPGPR